MARHRKPPAPRPARPVRIPVALTGAFLALGLVAGQAGGELVQDVVSPAHDVRPAVNGR